MLNKCKTGRISDALNTNPLGGSLKLRLGMVIEKLINNHSSLIIYKAGTQTSYLINYHSSLIIYKAGIQTLAP